MTPALSVTILLDYNNDGICEIRIEAYLIIDYISNVHKHHLTKSNSVDIDTLPIILCVLRHRHTSLNNALYKHAQEMNCGGLLIY